MAKGVIPRVGSAVVLEMARSKKWCRLAAARRPYFTFKADYIHPRD